MSVPITGALIAVLGLWLFCFSPRLLYGAMIISIPFSATAVANLGSAVEGKGIAAWLFLGTLWVIRDGASRLPVWRKQGWLLTHRARWALLGFLGAVVVSLSVPLVLNGTAWLPDPDALGTQTVAIQFSFYNVTQTGYLAFGVLLTILTAAENCRTSRLFYTLRLYVGSCVFVAAWGLLQFWCNVTGYTYPDYIFNTSATAAAFGYKEAVALGAGAFGRISSAALEPSVLAEELLIALVVLLVSIKIGRPLLSKTWDRVAIGVIVATLVASTSTTAYTGLLMGFVIAAVTMTRARRPAKFYFVIAGALSGLALLVATLVPFVGQLASAVLTDKLQTGSGMDRMHSISMAAKDFLHYPILGAGWHTVTCSDTVFLILANTGLVGIITFGWFVLPVIRGLWADVKCQTWGAMVLLPTIALALVLAEAVGLSYAAGYIWLVLGLGTGALVASRNEASSRKLDGMIPAI